VPEPSYTTVIGLEFIQGRFVHLGEKKVALSVQDLLSLQKVPSAEELSLQTIAFFYEEHISRRQIVYNISHKRREIRLRFKEGDLCHLLGIHHTLKGWENTGEKGFNKLKKGVVTLETLKANAGLYKKNLFRILYFPFVYQLISNPKIITGDREDIVQPEFVFFDEFSSRIIKLKIRQENKKRPNFFVPVSFEVETQKPFKKIIEVRSFSEVDYFEGYESEV